MRRRDCLVAITAALGGTPALADSRDIAEGINKAGRQRMLSQRMAKSYLAVGQAVDGGVADRTLRVSISQFERQLAELRPLASQPAFAEALRQLESSWVPYRTVLTTGQPDRTRAPAVLSSAAQVLARAQECTTLLVALSGQAIGRCVDTSGRQRMLSQRMAVLYLGASWGLGVESANSEIASASAAFAAAQGFLLSAPQSTAAIRDELALANQQWTFFGAALRGLRAGVADPEAMGHVFTSSERILEVMEDVTGQYAKLG